jgi:hypothetical protein
MLDLNALLTGLTSLANDPGYSDPSAIALALGLDLSKAKCVKMKRGDLVISGARMSDGAAEVGIVAMPPPNIEIMLFFDTPALPYSAIAGRVFGSGQHILNSKASDGFSILFRIGDVPCGITVSSGAGVVQTIFCKGPV